MPPLGVNPLMRRDEAAAPETLGSRQSRAPRRGAPDAGAYAARSPTIGFLSCIRMLPSGIIRRGTTTNL